MVIDCGVGTRMSCFLGSLECPVWFVVRSTGQVCTQSECLAVWHLKNSLACRILGDEIEWVMMSTKHTKIKLIFYFLYHRWCTFTVLFFNKKRVVYSDPALCSLSLVRGTGTPWGVYSGSTLKVEGGIFVA